MAMKRLNKLLCGQIAVPSQAPANLTLTSSSSTSITASWQLPSVNFRNGIIRGFKLFYKMKYFPGKQAVLTILNGTSLSKEFIGLAKYTEYEARILAFTSVGDGPKREVKLVKTNEDGGYSRIVKDQNLNKGVSF